MDNIPFVSIVVATFNRKDLVAKCLDSLFDQSYPKDRYEVIIINDGSIDGTEDVLKEYTNMAPCKFRWFTQKNSGQTVAFNLGIQNSRGDIVCITGDDCTAERDWIKNIVKCYDSEEIGGVGGVIADSEPKTFIENYAKKINLHNQEKAINISIIGGNSSFRKDVLDKVNGFDTFFRTGQDTEISLRILLMGYKFKFAPDAVIHHKHKATLSGLLEQYSRYGGSYARLHKKYPKYFHPGRRIKVLSKRVVKKLLIFPIKVLKAIYLGLGEGRPYFYEYIVDIATIISMMLGIIKEVISGKKFTGEKVYSRMEFIENSGSYEKWGL